MITTVLYFRASDMKTKLNVNLSKAQSLYIGARFNCCAGIDWTVFGMETSIGPNSVVIKLFIDNNN